MSEEGNDTEFTIIDWEKGAPEVALIAAIVGAALGLPLLIQVPQLLQYGQVLFYVVLYVFGFLGHVDDIDLGKFDEVDKERVLWAVVAAILGYFAILLTFIVGLTILDTGSQFKLVLDKVQLAVFNGSFVVTGEELVFRDSVPFLLAILFMKITKNKETASIVLAFLFSSILFGTLHIWAYAGDAIGVLKAIIAGIILSIIRFYGGLFASWMAHLFYNLSVIAGLFVFF